MILGRLKNKMNETKKLHNKFPETFIERIETMKSPIEPIGLIIERDKKGEVILVSPNPFAMPLEVLEFLIKSAKKRIKDGEEGVVSCCLIGLPLNKK